MNQRILHAVAFWLKADAPDATAEDMSAFYRDQIAALEGVEHAFVGPPAGTERDVVDGTYQVMSAVVFRDADVAAAWQSHPVHTLFLDRFGATFARVVVYDSIV